jgi:hypothetical protein
MEDIANNFIIEFLQSSQSNKEGMREIGIKLAQKIRSKAIDLSFNKATEFSPNIEMYMLLSAKIAFLVLAENSENLQKYEKSVYYYKCFTPPSWIVAEYDNFKINQKNRDQRIVNSGAHRISLVYII